MGDHQGTLAPRAGVRLSVWTFIIIIIIIIIMLFKLSNGFFAELH